MTSAITLTALTKSYSATSPPALQGVNLDVLAGSSTAIVGPSGSGKSTILRIIAGLEDANGGQVRLAGRDVTALLPEQRGIGMVFQRPLLFPHLSVLDNVAFADRAAGFGRAQARERAGEYLEMVRMSAFASRPPQSLSGGQEQRVAIARALASRPSVLLLDEPFSALDPALKEDMQAMIAEIRATLGPTILFVTHDRDEATAMADRIAVLEDGQLLQHDTVDRVYQRPASLAVAKQLGGRNAFPGYVSGGRHTSELGSIDVSPDLDDGNGALVFRQEAVTVSRADIAPFESGYLSLHGTVTATVRRGPRGEVVVNVGGTEVHAEASFGETVARGDAVTLSVPRESLWIVAE